MMTKSKRSALQTALEERALSMQVFNECPGPSGFYVVWLYAADDPALGAFVGDDDDLDAAIAKAIHRWDHGRQPKAPAPLAKRRASKKQVAEKRRRGTLTEIMEFRRSGSEHPNVKEERRERERCDPRGKFGGVV